MERSSAKLVFLALVAAVACVTLPMVEAACKRDIDCKSECSAGTLFAVCNNGKCSCLGGSPMPGGVCKVDSDCAKLCPPGSKTKSCVAGKCLCGAQLI